MSRPYRVGIIGSSQRGGYGHGLDTAFKDLELFEVVAVADDDPAGLVAAGKRLGVSRLHAVYRDMLAKEKLDLVSIGPRWITERVAMVTAAAAAGCHIFLEKPLAATLHDADAMLAACQRAKVKCARAHQLHALPPLREAFPNAKGKAGVVEAHQGSGIGVFVPHTVLALRRVTAPHDTIRQNPPPSAHAD